MERSGKDRARIAFWALEECGERSDWSTKDFRRVWGTVRVVH
jgi:hypothetical protein